MSCPFFQPVARLDRGDWVHAPRLPLGDPYRGVCHAVAGEPFEPPESDQRELCNCGYARGRCSRIPLEAADAVRFSVTDESSGGLKITWVIEKDHVPLDFGNLECAEGAMPAPNPALNAMLTAQAEAFVRSYREVIAT